MTGLTPHPPDQTNTQRCLGSSTSGTGRNQQAEKSRRGTRLEGADTEATAEIRERLDGSLRAAAAARRALQGLSARLPPELYEEVLLLANELVTNSIRHGNLPSWIELHAELRPGAVRVEVVDPGPGFEPRVPRPTLDQTFGRGLFLVENVADRWGMYNDGTTSVWFELDLPR